MAATVEQIAQYFDNRNWTYRLEAEKGRIVTAVQADNLDDFTIVVQLEEDGRFFKLFAPHVLTGVKDHPHKAVVLQAMLSISWETKMLQWEYDPSDGEIRAIIEFPLEDAPLTEQQFNRCLTGLIQIVDDFALPRLQETLATGVDPGDEEAGERLLLTLQEESPGLLQMLERAMEARKRRGLFPGEDLS